MYRIVYTVVILYQGKGEYIAIGQDIQFMKNYIDVEKFRWGNDLMVSRC